jgi:mono/diheme cytochrome c family protein
MVTILASFATCAASYNGCIEPTPKVFAFGVAQFEHQASLSSNAMNWRTLLVLAHFGLLNTATICADEPPPSQALFQDRVAGILERHCVSCHSGSKPKGGLSLVTAKQSLAGGESGVVIVPGKPDESLIVEHISGDQPEMPKNAKPLSADEVTAIRAWIQAGATWPEDIQLADKKQNDRDWWSLKPLARPTVPQVESPWIRMPVDAFILAEHQKHGLRPSPEADRRTLIRRLYFDLLGLPPSPEEVDTLAADNDPQAYEKLVDRLLAMPQYGERWGRHWLDVVHYGDTHGYDKDKVRPNAWPYRDYVIRSFNDDKPYSRFIEEQLAGDKLFPGTADGVIATGFIVAGPFDFVGQIELREGTLDKAITRNLDRDDMVSTAMNTFNSMTVQCARCHNHKFDPITQEDYYSLQAVFAGVDRADRSYSDENAGDKSAADSAKPEQVVYAAATHFKPNGEFKPTDGKPRPVHVLDRGNEKSPGAEVGPGTASYLPDLGARFDIARDADEGTRREALARWLCDRRNPLTWRSIVNRVWQYHFGRGIVDSSNDFGRMGSLPTHPELLDWLATEFRDGGQSISKPQSIKQLHRLICTSAAYRQSSAGNAEFEKVDGGNQFLWRMNRRKLEAEAIRDSVLAVAGKLDRTLGGPGFQDFGFQDDESPRYRYGEYDPDDPKTHRRSVYRFIVRSVPSPFMTTLDCADSSAAVARRNETLTPLQSLALLNNKFMVRMAEHFAARVVVAGIDLRSQTTAAWRLALSREPGEEELRTLLEYAEKHGLVNACRLILNTNEFAFVD